MSRRFQIKFTGLRFFLQKTEGKVSRKELVDFTHRFFTSRGITFGTLRVEFRMTRRPTDVIDGAICPITGQMYHGEHRVEVYLGAVTSSMTPPEIMEVIAHEADHEAWEREGRRFDNSKPYRQRSHEVRANAVGAKWQRRFEARM